MLYNFFKSQYSKEVEGFKQITKQRKLYSGCTTTDSICSDLSHLHHPQNLCENVKPKIKMVSFPIHFTTSTPLRQSICDCSLTTSLPITSIRTVQIFYRPENDQFEVNLLTEWKFRKRYPQKNVRNDTNWYRQQDVPADITNTATAVSLPA